MKKAVVLALLFLSLLSCKEKEKNWMEIRVRANPLFSEDTFGQVVALHFSNPNQVPADLASLERDLFPKNLLGPMSSVSRSATRMQSTIFGFLNEISEKHFSMKPSEWKIVLLYVGNAWERSKKSFLEDEAVSIVGTGDPRAIRFVALVRMVDANKLILDWIRDNPDVFED